MKKLVDLKVIELREGIYQIEAGRKAIVIPAKSLSEAIKKACMYLGINCNKNTLNLIK